MRKYFVCATWMFATLVLGSARAAHGQEVSEPSDRELSCRDTASDPLRAFAPVRLQSALADYARVAEVAGIAPVQPRLLLRPSNGLLSTCLLERSGGPWSERLSARATTKEVQVAVFPIELQLVENSGYPNDRNNGALWAGRGLSAELAGGIAARWNFLSAAIAPAVTYQQNADFPLVETNVTKGRPFHSPWYGGIDLPQRFGLEPYVEFDPGQSYIRADAFGATVGLSTENMWWGPGIRNSILMGNAAPGFPHAFVGTSRPANVGIGKVEGQVVWGRLSESGYFDTDPTNDERLFTALTMDYEPRWLPNLFLGFARIYQYVIPESGLEFDDYFPFFQSPFKEDLLTPDNPTGNDPDDQMISFYGRWVLPESGFEVYGEWARADHSWDFDDFVQEPDHTQAYSLGLQKVVPAGARWVRISAELTHLQEKPVARQGRPTGVYYTHSAVRQGYTHRGQLLGAWIGPGADSQFLGVDLFGTNGRSGVFLERVRRNDLVFYTRLNGEGFRHDAELTGGVRHLVFWRDLEVDLNLAYSARQNREFGADDSNLTAAAHVVWRPRIGGQP